MLGELFASWMRVLTQPNVETFEEEKSGSDATKLLVSLLIAGLAIGLTTISAEDSTRSILLGIVTRTIVTMVELVGLAYILFAIAKLLGGAGTFLEHCYLLSLPVLPLLLLGVFVGRAALAAAIWEPLAPLGLERYLPAVIGLYGFFLLLLALQAAHQLRTSHVVNVTLIAIALWVVLSVAAMFVVGADNVVTKTARFIGDHAAELWVQTYNHAWLVIFSMVIAIAIGVVIGILITLPSRVPRLGHLWLLIPLVLSVVLYLAARGTFGDALRQTLRDVSRQMRGYALVVVVLTVLLYLLFLIGEHAAEAVLYAAGIMLTFPSIGLFGLLLPDFGIGFMNAAVALILYAQLPILRNTYTGIKQVPSAVVESARGMGMTEWQILYKIKLPMTIPIIMAGVRISMVMIVGIAAIARLIGVTCLGTFIFQGIGRGSRPMVLAGAIGVSIFALLVDGLLGWAQRALTPAGLRER